MNKLPRVSITRLSPRGPRYTVRIKPDDRRGRAYYRVTFGGEIWATRTYAPVHRVARKLFAGGYTGDFEFCLDGSDQPTVRNVLEIASYELAIRPDGEFNNAPRLKPKIVLRPDGELSLLPMPRRDDGSAKPLPAPAEAIHANCLACRGGTDVEDIAGCDGTCCPFWSLRLRAVPGPEIVLRSTAAF